MCAHQYRITHWYTPFFFYFLHAPPISNTLLWQCSSTAARTVKCRKNIRDQVGPGERESESERESERKKRQTSPFNFLKTFQHLFCTLTYANSKGPQWLGSHFRPSVEPESSSAVKWERRSAVWKWISLAEIRGALSEPCTPSMGKKNCCTNCFWYIKYLLLYFTDGKQ